MRPALQVGGLSGLSGLFVGGISGVLRATTPFLFALGTGVQWFTLGTTFWTARGVLLSTRDMRTERDDMSGRLSASTLAGAMAGGVGGLLRGRKNVVPGAVMFAIFGGLGQAIYNTADSRHARAGLTASNVESWMNSKWSPIKVLSDPEYEKMLQEKLLRVNAELALVDEDLARLRAQGKEVLSEVRE